MPVYLWASIMSYAKYALTTYRSLHVSIDARPIIVIRAAYAAESDALRRRCSANCSLGNFHHLIHPLIPLEREQR